MSELNISENIDLYTLEPNSNIIEFKLDTDDISELSSNTTEINSKENEIKIKNNSNNYLAFKIKTTQKDNYALSSGYFILFPKNEKIITIKFRRMEGVKLKLKSHKVLIEGFAVNDEEKDLDAHELYDKYKKNKIPVVGKAIILKTKFVDKNGNTTKSGDNKNKEEEDSLFATGVPQKNEKKDDLIKAGQINENKINIIEKEEVAFEKIPDICIIIALIVSLIAGLCLFN